MGLPKSMKSSILLYMAIKAWEAGNLPLLIGFEMHNDEQYDRLASLLSGVSLTKIQNGTLTTPRGAQGHESAASAAGHPPLHPDF